MFQQRQGILAAGADDVAQRRGGAVAPASRWRAMACLHTSTRAASKYSSLETRHTDLSRSSCAIALRAVARECLMFQPGLKASGSHAGFAQRCQQRGRSLGFCSPCGSCGTGMPYFAAGYKRRPRCHRLAQQHVEARGAAAWAGGLPQGILRHTCSLGLSACHVTSVCSMALRIFWRAACVV